MKSYEIYTAEIENRDPGRDADDISYAIELNEAIAVTDYDSGFENWPEILRIDYLNWLESMVEMLTDPD